jgi:hypothetical protein
VSFHTVDSVETGRMRAVTAGKTAINITMYFDTVLLITIQEESRCHSILLILLKLVG